MTIVGGQRGQATVVMVGAIVGMLFLAALVVDGGYAWVQERIVQNATDASAEAGAVVIAEKMTDDNVQQAPAGTAACSLAASPTSADLSAYWDCRILAAISATAAANGVTVSTSYYTDVCGTPIPSTATPGQAATVGGPDQYPADPGPALACDDSARLQGAVGPVAGVRSLGTRQFRDLFFAQATLGNAVRTAATDAIAVAGPIVAPCSGGVGSGCSTLQISLPFNRMTCDQTGDAQWASPPDYELGVTVVLPICKLGSGNFGWTNWSPTSGTVLPSWLDTENGRKQAALSNLIVGNVYLMPVFDWACKDATQPTGTDPATFYGCPYSGITSLDLPTLLNTASNWKWYHATNFRAFRLEQVLQDNQGVCAASQVGAVDQNKSTDCLVGKFESIVTSGVVVGGVPGTLNGGTTFGVQLIE